MFLSQHLSFRVRVSLLVGICALGISLLPPSASQAAVTQKTIDNAITDFAKGSFQRTVLGPLQNTALSPKDVSGAIQLGPIGLLKTWVTSPFNLKKNLFKMGATAIDNRLFIIGGITPVSNSSQSVADVWSAAVSQTNGSFTEDWQAEPSLPPVQGSNQTGFTTPVAAINSPGVTSVATGNGAGYIYVIGGNASAGTFDFSSYAVRIGVVGTTGHITSWVAGPSIPSPIANDTQNISQLGLQSPAVTSLKVGNQTYVYVIGGLKRYRSGTGGQATTVSEGSKDVFYARVGSGGQLVKPSTGAAGWDKWIPIPIPGASPAGLWDASIYSDHYLVSTGDSADILYVAGGQITPQTQSTLPSFNSTIYRAFVASDGKLTWDFGWQGTLPQTRTAFSGVTFHGSLYAVGGLPNNSDQPDRGVLTTYVEDNMELHQFNAGEIPPGVDGGGSNFLKNDALPFARAFHATAIVPADDTSQNTAFVYVFGGRGSTADGNPGDDFGTANVIFGRIGGGEDVSTTGYASSGWYYSKPYDVDFGGTQVAQLQTIRWYSQINRTNAAGADIAIQYRISSGDTCATATWNESSWQSVKATQSDASHQSANGVNTSPPINLAARCFQYRAKLATDNFLVTPSLLNMSIDVFVPGNPDINFNGISVLKNGTTLTGIKVLIQNVNKFEPTLAADLDLSGSFFVDMCIFGPGETVVKPTIPFTNQNMQCSDAYADINRSFMGANSTFNVTKWLASKGTNHDKPVDILSFFKTPGNYSVILVADSYNNVYEGTLGGEGNNISQTITFTVNKTGYIAYVPLVKR